MRLNYRKDLSLVRLVPLTFSITISFSFVSGPDLLSYLGSAKPNDAYAPGRIAPNAIFLEIKFRLFIIIYF